MAVLVLLITLGIFVVVGGLLAFCVVRFRRRVDDDGSEPAQVYGSNRIEFAWTVVPNHTNHMWFDPRREGVYLGQCAEFCGTQHARMLLRVYVQSRQDFEAWVASQRTPAVDAADVAEGRRIFQTTACVNCHSAEG